MPDFLNVLISPWRDPRTLGLAVAAAVFLVGAGAVTGADRSARDKAFGTMIAQTPAQRRTVTADAAVDPMLAAARQEPNAQVEADTTWIRDQLAATVPLAPVRAGRGGWAQVVLPSVAVVRPAPSAVAAPGSQAFFQVRYRQGDQSHARLVAGRWPVATEGPAAGGGSAATAADGPAVFEIAVTAATMSRYGLTIGSVLVLDSSSQTELRVVGCFDPDDPSGVYWQTDPLALAPVLDKPLNGPPYWTGGALLAPADFAGAAAVLGIGATRLTWTFVLDTAGYGADDAAGLDRALENGLRISPDALQSRWELQEFSVKTALPATLRSFLDGQRVERYETAVPEASLAAIGLIALGLLARSALRRREGEYELLLARGISVRMIPVRAAGACLTVVAPLGTVAFAVSRLLPGAAADAPLWSLAIPALAVLMPAVMALMRYRRRRPVGRPAARRAVAVIALAGLCLAGLQQVRTHGVGTDDGVDLFAACAPLFGAALASMLALGLAPALLGVLVRRARRGPGAVGLLGVGRIVYAPEQAAMTVFTVTLTLTTLDVVLALRGAPQVSGAQALPPPVRDAAAGTLLALGVVTLAAAVVLVALAAAGDTVEQAVTAARLGALGLTAGQARAVALAEAAGPVALAALGATAAAPVMAWVLGPALAAAVGGVGMKAWMLAVPVAAVAPGAALAGVGGAALARRGMLGALRLGDSGGGAR